jgi:hypothetical protein
MTPADLRDATWESIQPMLTGMRLAVLGAWRLHGPGTTEAIAARAGINILTFRPRTTELVQLGLVLLADRDGHQGVYKAVSQDAARAAFEAEMARQFPRGQQALLKL